MSALSPLRWPRPKPPSPSDPRPNDKNSSGKRSLNALFGLKSKKPVVELSSSVTSVLPDADSRSVLYANRPPSKSVSSTQSRVDSIGPKTPSDVRESRQSLLTLSDHDPFAGRGITLVTSQQSAIGSNRLSVHSNSSLPEAIGGKLDNRALFPPPTLISPKERPVSPDFALFSGYPTYNLPDIGPKQTPSAAFLRKRPAALDAAFSPALEDRTTKSSSSSTLTDMDRPPTLILPTRPPMRARGLTESAMTSPYSNHRGTISSPSSPHHALLRQVSLARLGSPPSAPPKQKLPPPPIPSIRPNADASGENDDVAPAVPALLPFTCASSDTLLSHSPRRKCKWSDASLICPEKSSTSTRKLKKAVSHNSMAKLSISTSPLEPLPIQMDQGMDQEERSPCKRSFHQSKLQALPIITRPPSTLPMPSSPSGSQSPYSEQRRGSNSSLPGRRRLFSATRRPSISQGNSTEDDAQSIFSLRSEQISSSLSWARPSSCSPSFCDDTASDEPSSPQHSNKYTPQHIMSPAAMAEVEASVESIASPRSRGMSISTITSSTDREDELSTPSTSPALSPFSSSSSTFPSRSSSFMFKGSTSPPQRIAARPATSQANMTSSTNENPTYRPSSSPPLSLMSLPPPPRPRQRTTTAPPSSKPPTHIKRHDTTFLRPSSSASTTSTDGQLHPNTSFPTYLHPPRKSLLPKTSMEKFFRRHSLLRKPSFLEIDDEITQDPVDKGDPRGGSPDDSFLDLTRESFDTSAN